jgi:hypothetical protein
MATKQQDTADEQDAAQEQNGSGGLHVNVEGDMILIELPRDGNEADTLSRLSKFVDGF